MAEKPDKMCIRDRCSMVNTKEIKKKGLKGVKTIIFGRTLMVVLAFVIQFLLLTSIYIWLREYSLSLIHI